LPGDGRTRPAIGVVTCASETGPGRDHRRHAHALDEAALCHRLGLRQNLPLLLLEEADAFGRLLFLAVVGVVLGFENLDRRQRDSFLAVVGRNADADVPVAALGNLSMAS
jgi:hypothetical protein